MLYAYQMTEQGPEQIGTIDENGRVLRGQRIGLLYGMRAQMPKEPMPTEEDWLKKYGHGSRLWVTKA